MTHPSYRLEGRVRERLSKGSMYRVCKIVPACLKIPALVLPGQFGQPMHSQSANFGKLKPNSHNLAGLILHGLHHSVYYIRYSIE